MRTVDIRKKLDNFTLDVQFETDREILALLGASGCGKSMTLKCIAGIEKPDEGRIVLNDRVLFDSDNGINLSPQKRRVGYLFQQYALFPNMTVEKNIAAGCMEKNRERKKALVSEKIEKMHLSGLEHKYPSQLSGGQQQRVALARILINDPELLLLDEPFSALDSFLKWQLEMELADDLKEFGRGALFVSHSKDEVFRLCDAVCVLNEGESESKQYVAELFSEPATRAAAKLAGCENFSDLEWLEGNRVYMKDWGIALETSGRNEACSSAGIYAKNIIICKSRDRENAFAIRIVREIKDLRYTVLVIEPVAGCAKPLRVNISGGLWDRLRHEKQLYASVASSDIMLLNN